jgi:hypothetical protein
MIGYMMKTMTLSDALTAFAAEYLPQLALLFAEMPPMPWLARLETWLGDCRANPAIAMTEPALAEALGLFVSLRHARMRFGLLEPARWARQGTLVSADQGGGAVLAAAAGAELMRLIARHDRELAMRLAETTLRRNEVQRAALAKHIDAQG